MSSFCRLFPSISRLTCLSLAIAPQVEFVDLSTVKFEDAAPIPANDDDEDAGAQFQYYKSDKILGRLFRAVDEERIWHDSVRYKVKRDPTLMWETLRHKVDRICKDYGLNWRGQEEKARELRTL